MQPEVQSQVAWVRRGDAEHQGLSAAQAGARASDADVAERPVRKCGDDAFLKKIYLWKTPLADCGNGKNDCTDYSRGHDKWTAVRAG